MGVLTVFMALIGMAGGLVALDQSGPLRAETTFIVERGESFSGVATRLEREGVIGSVGGLGGREVLLGAAQLLEMDGDLKAGEYKIPARSSVRQVLGIVTSGKGVNRSVTIPEGWTVWQAVGRINETEGMVGEISELPPEGTLLPDTYFYSLGEDRQDVLDRMLNAHTEVFDTLWAGRANDLPYTTKAEALVMASIVERETGGTAEREVVASVYVNRLRDGWRLQADPTVIYGINNGQAPLRRGLRRSELLDESNPYNTYKIYGLPPGPIANPGVAAIEATLNPADTPYFFFVVACEGGHTFTTNLPDHNRAVAEYRDCEAVLKAPSTPPLRPEAPAYVDMTTTQNG